MISVLAIACNSGDGSEQPSSVSESTVTPAAVPSNTTGPEATIADPTSVPPTTTATAGAGSATGTVTAVDLILPELSLSVASIDECRLSGDLKPGGVSRQGTAPAPTPTPTRVASGDPRDPAIVGDEMRAFGAEFNPIISSLTGFREALQTAWPQAESTDQQAAQLHVFGNRLAQLCSAASETNVPPEIRSEAIGFGESLRISNAWTILALEELNCCGTAQTDFFDVGYDSTSLESVRTSDALVVALRQYMRPVSGVPERVVTLDRFGLDMTVTESAVVVRNSIDVVVVFPEPREILDPAYLGPDPWTFGTAVRIRRLRNSSDLSVDQALVEYAGLINRFGEPQQSGELEVSSFDNTQLSFPGLDYGWTETTVAFVLDGFTYVVETMCHPELLEQCEFAERTVESLAVS